MWRLAIGLIGAAGAAAAADLPLPPQVSAVPIPPGQVEAAIGRVDDLVADVMAQTGIPGVAVAVVHDGRVALARGYGLREAGKPGKVDADTVFQLASVSKSVAATVVATRIGPDLAWDTPVTDLLPWFALSDPRATAMLTLADLFSHRSGLPDHAGDELEDLGYDRRAVLERLRFLPLEGFRDHYAYTNFGLTAAAEAVATAAGTDWAALSDAAIYAPLGMARTSSRFDDYVSEPNRAVLHMRSGDAWAPLAQRRPDAQSPAGGVSSTAADMARWMAMVLGAGTYDGRPVVPPEPLLAATSPQSVSSAPYAPDARADFYGFGIGVGTSATARVQFSHSGGFYLGAGTVYRLIPSAGVGIVVLTNAQPIGAAETIALAFADLVEQGEVTRDWYPLVHGLFAPMFRPVGRLAGATPPAAPAAARPPAAYAGAYTNDYVGPIEIAEAAGGLVLRAGPEARAYPLHHWSGDSFYFDVTGENGPTGSRSEVAFTMGADGAEAVTVELWDSQGLGTFTR